MTNTPFFPITSSRTSRLIKLIIQTSFDLPLPHIHNTDYKQTLLHYPHINILSATSYLRISLYPSDHVYTFYDKYTDKRRPNHTIYHISTHV